MCDRTDSANRLQQAAECLAQACLAITPRSYRQLLNDTLNEETPPEWAELLKKLS